MILIACFVLCTLVIIPASNGFYLPGLAPVNYCKEKDGAGTKTCKKDVALYVNRLNTEESVIPYDMNILTFAKLMIKQKHHLWRI